MQNNGHAGWLEPGGSMAEAPLPAPRQRGTRPPGPAWAGGGTVTGGCSQLPPAPARAGPGVALKIHHEVMDKNPPAAGAGGHPPQPGRPPTAHRPGAPHHAVQPAGRRRDRETTAGARGRAAHQGHRTGMAAGTGTASPPGLAASRDVTWPGPRSCAGWARDNEQGEGPGLRQHCPPTRENQP